MNKKLDINITCELDSARISIIGEIYDWNSNSAVNFRDKCQAAKEIVHTVDAVS